MLCALAFKSLMLPLANVKRLRICADWVRIAIGKNTIFEPETCEIGPKIVIWTCPDLPRPVQEDKYLLQTNGNIFLKNYTFPSFVNKEWKGVISGKRKAFPLVCSSTCPPAQVLASPDMSKVRVLVKFRTFRVENWVFDEISRSFCIIFRPGNSWAR